MVATAPKKSAASFQVSRGARTPDLAYFRQRYPETVASLGALPRREEWLRRIWELEARWQSVWETRGGESVGLVQEVEGSLTGSRLVVGGSGGEVLIPLVSEICTEIDPAAKRIVIDPPAGLLDLNR